MSKALGISGFAFHNAAMTEPLTKPDCSKFHTMALLSPSLSLSGTPTLSLSQTRLLFRVRVKIIRTFGQKKWLAADHHAFAEI